MIRSTKATVKFANRQKLNQLTNIHEEYNNVIINFIDILWEMRDGKIPSLLPKEITNKVDTWLSARLIQSAGKVASGIVRGTLQKQKQRMFVYNRLLKENKLKRAKKLKSIIDTISVSKPVPSNKLPIQLDSRFVKIDLANDTSFDGWLVISSIGNNIKLQIPFKKSTHFNKLSTGKLLNGISLTPSYIKFNFEFEKQLLAKEGDVIGIDVGILNTITCSNGHQSVEDIHGHNLSSIQKKLTRKKANSNSYKRTQEHRKNYINWTINQLNLNNISTIKCENIKHLRKNKRTSKYMSRWTYTLIFDKLKRKCEEENVSLILQSPTYTSQRCFRCGWVRKSNRKGKLFKCSQCNYVEDSDLNASKNIALDLPPIRSKERLLQKNKTGFYWNEVCQEPIVPGAPKNKII